jgi:hypothetical protein
MPVVRRRHGEVTMPAYLIRHRQGQQGDILIEDPDLTLDSRHGWAVLTDQHGTVLAIPVDQVASIQRINDLDGGQAQDDGTRGRS